MGGTFFISAAESIFANELVKHLKVNVAELDPEMVIGLGATQFRNTLPAAAVPGVVLSYMQSLRTVFILATTLAGMATLVGLIARWEKIKARI